MHIPIGQLRPGASPTEVMDQAVLVLSALHVVETKEVEAPLVGGRRVGRVALRFAVEAGAGGEEDAEARNALQLVIDHLEGTTASVGPKSAVVLTRGVGGRFRPIPWG